MKTERLEATEEGIRRAGELLKNGGLVAIPTETVYGLAANACDGRAVSKIFAAKGRPMDNPLIVHICREEQILELVELIQGLDGDWDKGMNNLRQRVYLLRRIMERSHFPEGR